MTVRLQTTAIRSIIYATSQQRGEPSRCSKHRDGPGTAADYRAMLDNYVRPHFGPHAKVADVTFSHVDALHRKITKSGKTYAANRCIAVVSNQKNRPTQSSDN